MKRVAVAVLVTLCLHGVQTAGAVTAKNALVYGDSLVYESRFQLTAQANARPGWSARTHTLGGSAPCDWLPWIASDIATYHPTIVGVETAGNTLGISSCMTAPMGSTAYFAQYRADLSALFQQVTASGVRVVYFNSIGFKDPVRNAAVKQINAIALDLAMHIRNVSIAGSVRTAIGGVYVDTKPCLATETAAMGCSAGRITIRSQLPALDAGLHLCPTGLYGTTLGQCPTYSSGEFRFARSMMTSLASPPKPKLT